MTTVNDLPAHVHSSLRRRGLIRRGARLVVAVSGGLDSMVLLHVMRGLAKENRWHITVAHLNHRLRGQSSLADERLVRRVAKQLGLPIVTERVDMRALARAKKLSLEMAARHLRHDFLARTARSLRAPIIALAHHADDQVELFFLRLFRGSGGEGLAGMDWRGPSPADRKITLVRPFLDLPKSELRAYAKEHNVPFREDATNACLDIQRNRIRHELLPLLRRHYQPALDRTILRAMEIIGAETEFVEAAAKSFERRDYDGKLNSFQSLPVAVQRQLIRGQLSRAKIAAQFDLVEELRNSPEHPITVAGGQVISLDADGCLQLGERDRPGRSGRRPADQSDARQRSSFSVISAQQRSSARRLGQRPERSRSPFLIALDQSSSAQFAGVKFTWRIFPRRGNHLPRSRPGRELFDAARVGSRILLRHWRPGDRFQPIGMPAPVKLQDIFVNQKIPREQRHRIVLAEAANGEVFWVENLRISERFKLSNSSSHRLEWRWKRL